MNPPLMALSGAGVDRWFGVGAEDKHRDKERCMLCWAGCVLPVLLRQVLTESE